MSEIEVLASDKVEVSPPKARQRTFRRFFFVGLAIAMLIVVGMGFGRSFFLRPAYIDRPLPAYLIVHGATMTAWFLLFLIQTTLVSARRIDLHRKLGVAGLALAIGVVVTAVIVNLNLGPRALNSGIISRYEDAAGFALDSLSSLIPFVVLISLALILRGNSNWHKRLMFWAFAWMLGPAFAGSRPLGQFLAPLVAPVLPFFPSDFIWLFALMFYDWRTLRRVHPATYLPFILLFVYFMFATPLISGSEVLQSWLLAYWQARTS